MKRIAMINSLSATAEVEIIQYKDLNHVVVKYGEIYCTAIDNPFTGLIYCDDKYGVVDKSFRF